MKFIVSSTALLKQLQLIGGVISSNTVLPILEDFLLDLADGKLKVYATDLETSMAATINVESSDQGRIAVPARLLLDILKALPEQPITVRVNSQHFSVELTSERGKYKLAGENGEDFPRIPVPEETRELKMASSVLADAVSKTQFAVSTDDARPALSGIYVELSPSEVSFVATDAHRLVRYRRTDVKSPASAAFIVPRKAFQLLAHALPAESTQVHISYNKANVFFAFNNMELICRLIDARYPDYQAVIPKENPNQLVVNGPDLLSSLRRLIVLSNKTTHQANLKMSGNSLEITARDIDFSNEGSETIPCRYTGEEMEIGFNGKFLIEMLAAMDQEEVLLSLSTPTRACVMTPTQPADGVDLLMLVMPIMLNA